MTGLCGWFSGPLAPALGAAEATLGSMLTAGQVALENATLKVASNAGLALYGESVRPTLLEFDGLFLALAGHPCWVAQGARTTPPTELLRALQTHGPSALAQVGGDFSVVFWNAHEQRGLLAADRLGVHPLVYAHVNGRLAFASNLDLLGGHPGVDRTLSSQAIFDCLFYHVVPGPNTVFEGLKRVPPGHFVEFGPLASVEPRAYWALRFAPERAGNAEPSVEDLEQEFVALMQDAVREASVDATTGAFLSGGTDSSTVSGMLARVSAGASGGQARTFSIGFDAKGYDEMQYARLAAKHFGCEHHEYYVTPHDVVQALPDIAAAYDQPFGNASAIPTYYCAKFAREHGVTRLLAGDGGDELFGGNSRYAKQHLLSLYGRVPAGLKRSLIEPLLLSSVGQWNAPLRKLRSYVEQARVPMPQRYESYNLLMHLGLSNVFAPDFLAAVNPQHPHQLMTEAFAPHEKASLINQMQAIDFRFVLTDGDLPKVTRMCQLAGVDVAFPILDDRLIAFSERLPSRMKLRGTKLRWFFKHALRDFLPPAVIKKEKHGFGLPVGDWLVSHKPLLDLAGDSLDLLRTRGIVNPKFMDELLTRRLHEHPAYFGTMVWVLMMLGLWLDSRKL
jgi:asparagine synthase (glutamine-hydrolysing)